MRSYPSRFDRLETRLYKAAEKGELSINSVVLYQSEIRKLRRQGFMVFNVEPYPNHQEDLYTATLDWSSPFSDGIPHVVYSYINNVIQTRPAKYIKNFAQELYIIAFKSLKKG